MPTPISYDVTGQLQASSVYDGVKLPRLFRVAEPATGRTIVYVKPGPQFESHKALGRLVGIVGKTEFDAGLNLRIIAVEKLDILQVSQPKPATQDAESTARADE